MLSDDFFQRNNVVFQGDRINTLIDFKRQCPEYELEEHQGSSCNNTLYLSHIDGRGKIRIFLTGGGNELIVGKYNRINRCLQISFLGIYGKQPGKVKIEIGEKNIFNGNVSIASPVQECRCVHIGNHNLFADGVLFIGRNDHGIFDKTTHERLNDDHDVILGNRNWICKNVEFLPKSVIQDDCVIASHTVVNKAFLDNNVMIAGVPGIIKRRNIVWNISCDVTNLEENLLNPLHMARPD